MSLKVYIAAPFVNKAQAVEARDKFVEAGLDVTSRWLGEDLGLTTADLGKTEHDDVFQTRAAEDIEDILQSDVFVILNLGVSEGKATEMGFAYALGIPVILVGERTVNVFYHLPSVFRADSVEAAIDGIRMANNLEVVESNE